MRASLPTLRDRADLQQQDADPQLRGLDTSEQPAQSFRLFLQALGLGLFVFALVVKGGR